MTQAVYNRLYGDDSVGEVSKQLNEYVRKLENTREGRGFRV